MSHWQFVIRPLTPVHIGTGEPLEPYEYTILANRFYRLDLDGFLMALPPEQALQFAEMAGRSLAAARGFLRQQAALVQAHVRYSCPATPAAVRYYEEKLDERLSDLTVRAAVRAGGSTILPGSSVKGAIRTALLYAEMRKPLDGRRYERRSERLQRDTFGHRDPLDDPFKALKISDSLPPYGDAGRLHLAEVWVYRDREGTWGATRRGRLVVRLETTAGALDERTVIESVHQVQLDEGWQQRAGPRFRLEIGGLIAACRRFYDEHLEAEAAFLRAFPQAARVYAALREWRQQMPDHAFLLRLGWGSGLDGVSVNRALDYPRRTISRRLLDDGTPLGWVEVRVVSGEGQPFTPTRAKVPPPPPPPAEPPAQPTRLADLQPGMRVRGVVRSVVQFGAFVDIGVGKDGLLHRSEMGDETVQRGQEIEAWVVSVDLDRQRFGLSLVAGRR